VNDIPLLLSLAVVGALMFFFVSAQRRIRVVRRQLGDERKTVRELAILNDISSIIYKDLDAESMIETVVDKTKELVRSEFSALLLLENGRGTVYCTSLNKKTMVVNPEVSGILKRVMEESVSRRASDGKETEGSFGLPEPRPGEIRNIMVVPVLLRNEMVGELILANRMGQERYTDRDEDLLLHLGFHAAFALEKARLHQEVTKLATTDGLTGLNNHRTFQERLEMEIGRAKRFVQDISILMVDIDFFKRLNDTHGHRAGDDILKKIASRLKENVRSIDFVARYGGEEFVIILPETAAEGAALSAERIRRAIEYPQIKVVEEDEPLTVSIGVATFPKDASYREDLIEKADRALYAAKDAGRNRVFSYKDFPRL
jgi:diguanylate cyclase (GGDEF)-like protein